MLMTEACCNGVLYRRRQARSRLRRSISSTRKPYQSPYRDILTSPTAAPETSFSPLKGHWSGREVNLTSSPCIPSLARGLVMPSRGQRLSGRIIPRISFSATIRGLRGWTMFTNSRSRAAAWSSPTIAHLGKAEDQPDDPPIACSTQGGRPPVRHELTICTA
jgi:hypothetical protein